MKYAELRLPEADEKVRYNPTYYDNLRLSFNTIADEDAKEYAVHFSYCVQNLHKNFNSKINDLLDSFNRTHQLPHALYFEPKSNSFPIRKDKHGNRLSEDGLRVFSPSFVHHSDIYDMKSIGLTWNNLILQYQQSFDFAKENDLIVEWSKACQEGCFEGGIGEAYDWYLKSREAYGYGEPQRIEIQSLTSTSDPKMNEFLSLEEALTYAGNIVPNWEILKVEAALIEIKKVARIKDTSEFPDEEAIAMLVDIYSFDFEDEEKQQEFAAKRKRKAEMDKKIVTCFNSAKNQLKTPTSENLTAYISAYKEASNTFTKEPLKISVLDRFSTVIGSYTQLNNLLNLYTHSPSSKLLRNIREMETTLRTQISNLPKKPNIKDAEFIRVYSGPGGGLVAINNAFREQQQQIKRTIETVAKTQEAKTSKENVGSKRSEVDDSRNLLNEHLKRRRKIQPAELQVDTSVIEVAIQDQSELTNLLTENMAKLIQERAIELPSYIQQPALIQYLLGEIEIDPFLIAKGGRKTQQRPAVGNTTLSAQDHQQLLRELQSAFQDRGLASSSPKDSPDAPTKPAVKSKSQAKATAASSSSSTPSSSQPPATVTPEFIKRRLNTLFDEGLIGANYPLEGDKGILKFLCSQNAELAKRKVDPQFKTLVSANKQAGNAVQDKQAFLAHAKQFRTVSNLLTGEEKDAEQAIPVTTITPSHLLKGEENVAEKTIPVTTITPVKFAATSNQENIDPSTQQKTVKKPKVITCPSAIYDAAWQDFQNKSNQITLNKTDGFITQNAFKKIQHYSSHHSGTLETATEKHKRLTELRSLLLGINHKNIKNEELKKLITQYCISYNRLPEVPKRVLSWKRREQ